MSDPREKVRWYPALHAGWDILIARQTYHLWAAYHETYSVCASNDYGQSWAYRGRVHSSSRPSAMVMEPGEFHRTLSMPKGVSFTVLNIPLDEVERTARECGLHATPHLRHAVTEDTGLTTAVLALGDAIERGVSTPLALETMRTRILGYLLNQAEQAPSTLPARREQRAVARAKSYLQEYFAMPVTLDELSKIAELDRYRLVRAFTRDVGLPPHAYQIHLRIERSRHLLWSGLTGVQIASQLGFVDQSHFIRHFKRIMRATPRQYRRG